MNSQLRYVAHWIVKMIVLSITCVVVLAAYSLKNATNVEEISPFESVSPIDAPYLYDVNEMYLAMNNRSDKWLYLKGWFIERGVDSTYHKLNVILVDQHTGACYRLPTMLDIRKDVTGCFCDGDYDQSGFIVHIPLDDLFANGYYDYDVYFEVQYDGQSTYYDPELSLESFYEQGTEAE